MLEHFDISLLKTHKCYKLKDASACQSYYSHKKKISHKTTANDRKNIHLTGT